MAKSTRISAQNSQYSSTGVGFQIRNDLCATTTAHYPIFPSQAPAPRRAHTSAGARTSAILLQICRRSRSHVVVNANSMRIDIVPTSFSMPMQPLCDFNFTSPWSRLNLMPSTAQLRRNHCTSTTQCLPINFTTTLHILTNHSTTPCKDLTNYFDATQCNPISRSKISPKSLADHLQFTCESLELARPYAPIHAA